MKPGAFIGGVISGTEICSTTDSFWFCIRCCKLSWTSLIGRFGLLSQQFFPTCCDIKTCCAGTTLPHCKCQDIFSVHGYPVGLIQCENNPIGIVGVGAGRISALRRKYVRAKEYCQRPFEVSGLVGGNATRMASASSISCVIADLLDTREAYIAARGLEPPQDWAGTLDGVLRISVLR